MASTARSLDQNPNYILRNTRYAHFGEIAEIYDKLRSIGLCIDTDTHLFINSEIIHEHALSTPTKKLYRAILFQTLNDIFRPFAWIQNGISRNHTIKLRFFQRDALGWVLDESDWERSFPNVCSYLGLDSDYLKKKIIDLIREYKQRALEPRSKTPRLLLKRNSPKRNNVIRIKQ